MSTIEDKPKMKTKKPKLVVVESEPESKDNSSATVADTKAKAKAKATPRAKKTQVDDKSTTEDKPKLVVVESEPESKNNSSATEADTKTKAKATPRAKKTQVDDKSTTEDKPKPRGRKPKTAEPNGGEPNGGDPNGGEPNGWEPNGGEAKENALDIPENNIEVTVMNANSENEVVLNDHDEIVYSFHITNVHTNCTIQQLNDSLDILRLGDIFQISIHTKYDGPINGKEKNKDSRQSEAYVYYKGTKFLIKKHPFLQKLLTGKKTALVHFLDGDTWWCELNTKKHYHFRTDEYIHKRIIIQSISSKKHSTDINWIFREHGEVEQVDMVWVKSDKTPTPLRCQSYIYFKEWGDEEYTYKLLEELNEVGVFTIKYGFKDYNDLLWIYELAPKCETSTEYEFEYGQYPHWMPKDDPKYGSRFDENNKLNWIFSDEGRFAYSRRIVDDEIKAHGGLFIGPEKKFYKIEFERKPPQYSWTSEDGSETEEAQKIKLLIFKAVQKYLTENGIDNINNI